MSTKFRNSEEIRNAFQGLLQTNNEQDDIKFQSQMIMYRFLSEVEILCEQSKMTKKQLAEKIGTSASYITQLYRGNKPLNIETLAKFQKLFDITFEITTKSNHQKMNQDEMDEQSLSSTNSPPLPEGFWYYKKFAKPSEETCPPCYASDVDEVASGKSAA